jgi:hypothetical protein
MASFNVSILFETPPKIIMIGDSILPSRLGLRVFLLVYNPHKVKNNHFI